MTSARADIDVAVVGAGIAGLTAAYDLVAAGRRVVLLEPGTVGGTVRRGTVDGLDLDLGAESFARSPATVRGLLDELGLGSSVVAPAGSGAWVRHRSGIAPLPPGGWLGIPGAPWSAPVRRVIGWSGALRASTDLLRSERVGENAGTLGELVGTRMGGRVLTRLVDPVVSGVYSTPPIELELATLPPAVLDTIADHRTLTGAARALRSPRPAGGAVDGLDGGMYGLVTALTTAIGQADGRIDAVTVEAIEQTAASWSLTTPDGPLTARTVLVATDGGTARRLLGRPAVTPARGSIRLCTMVVDAPELDRAPRGTGVLVASGTPGIAAKALTHATAKWDWLARRAGPGRHVLRLSYGRVGERPPESGAFPGLAVADAGALLGVRLNRGQVRDWTVTDWSLPPTVDRSDLDLPPTLAVTGAWRSGVGLAAVIGHARTQAGRLLGVPAEQAPVAVGEG